MKKVLSVGSQISLLYHCINKYIAISYTYKASNLNMGLLGSPWQKPSGSINDEMYN